MTTYYKDSNGIGYSMKPGMLGPESGGCMPWKAEVTDRPTELMDISSEEYERLKCLCDEMAAMYFD